MKIAVVLFAYNRPECLEKCLESINFPIDFVFIDYSEKQNEVYDIIFPWVNKTGYELISLRPFHFGLANNIIEGINEVIKRGYDAVIVIEDDLILDPEFYPWIVKQLKAFKNPFSGVGSVSGYSMGTNSYRFLSWGWGTWRHVWQSFNKQWEPQIDEKGFRKIGYDLPRMYKNARAGKIESWAVRFAYHHFKNKLLCVHPLEPLVHSIGKNGTNNKWYSNFGLRPILRNLLT